MGSRLQAGKQANYLWYPMARFSRSMNLYQIILFMVCGLYPLHPGTTHLSKGFICTYAWPLQQPALYQAAESRSGAVNKGSGASAQAPPRYSHWDSHDVMRRKHEKTHKKNQKKEQSGQKWKKRTQEHHCFSAVTASLFGFVQSQVMLITRTNS